MQLSQVIAFLKDEIEQITLGRCVASKIQDDARIMIDLGLDSLDYAALMLSGESFLRVKVNEATVDWRKVATVSELATLLYSSDMTGDLRAMR